MRNGHLVSSSHLLVFHRPWRIVSFVDLELSRNKHLQRDGSRSSRTTGLFSWFVRRDSYYDTLFVISTRYDFKTFCFRTSKTDKLSSKYCLNSVIALLK